MARVKPDGFGYLLEAALNLFGVKEGRAAEWLILDWKLRCFSDDPGGKRMWRNLMAAI
ncbi:hypothetical protein NEISICOT_03443 [Neisseria sicca ATCC 29256]|uniref:Uncharacterized protein n=1 Tax=Neisseria sicca ATCC 29256 TaxID=547045 RepID=C6MA62_NEISI|nr:hypothetical protein NEISICOT_03443 [Neisseria sicca ATCC 29256]